MKSPEIEIDSINHPMETKAEKNRHQAEAIPVDLNKNSDSEKALENSVKEPLNRRTTMRFDVV